MKRGRDNDDDDDDDDDKVGDNNTRPDYWNGIIRKKRRRHFNNNSKLNGNSSSPNPNDGFFFFSPVIGGNSGGGGDDPPSQDDGDDNGNGNKLNNQKRKKGGKKSNTNNKTDEAEEESKYEQKMLPMDETAEALFRQFEGDMDGDWDEFGNTTQSVHSHFNFDECFACSRVGENSSAIKGTDIDKLVANMFSGLSTTDIGQHCINIANQYEETIRKKTNKNIMPGQKELPKWSPRVIKEHIEQHQNDPVFSIYIFMIKLKELISVVFKSGLIKRRKLTTLSEENEVGDEEDDGNNNGNNNNRRNMEGSKHQQASFGDVRIDLKNWKVVKEALELYMKLGRSGPEKMVPYFKQNRYIVDGNLGHPFFSVGSKLIQKQSKGINKSTTDDDNSNSRDKSGTNKKGGASNANNNEYVNFDY